MGARGAMRLAMAAWVDSASPTAMHEFADEQSTALKFVFDAPSTFGVGGTVHAADAADGARSIAAVANKTRRDGRGDICTATLRRAHALVKPQLRPLALDVSKRIAEDGHPGALAA
jgi:hypothetical protein